MLIGIDPSGRRPRHHGRNARASVHGATMRVHHAWTTYCGKARTLRHSKEEALAWGERHYPYPSIPREWTFLSIALIRHRS
jgi:hypothetical protein